MRRREAAPAPNAPPERFVYADWADEEADGRPPEYWAGDRWMWWRIRAFKRYLAARLAARQGR